MITKIITSKEKSTSTKMIAKINKKANMITPRNNNIKIKTSRNGITSDVISFGC
jgi:hypothetical protein